MAERKRHWYTAERFAHRVLLEIRRDPKTTVTQFLATFKGRTSSVNRSEVAVAVDLSYRPLADLLDASGPRLIERVPKRSLQPCEI